LARILQILETDIQCFIKKVAVANMAKLVERISVDTINKAKPSWCTNKIIIVNSFFYYYKFDSYNGGAI